MKKLMIAAAIVCAAAMSQAASIQWSATMVKSDKTGDSNASGYTALAFIQSSDASSSAATKAKWWALTDAVTALTQDSGADLTNFKVTDGKAVSSATAKNGAYTFGTAWTDDNWSDKTVAVQSYVIVFNNEDVSKATEFLVLKDLNTGGTGEPLLSTTFADAADNVTAKFGNQKTNLGWQTISTSAVPEPTSGLLLLLGVAGLALRRRRA